MVGIVLGIIVVGVLYYFLHKKDPPQVIDTTVVKTYEEVSGERSDLELYLPLNNELLKQDKTTIAGKTIYVNDPVIVVTGLGDFFTVKPDSNGTFSLDVPVGVGPNRVTVYAFPKESFGKNKQKTFFYFPEEEIGVDDQLTLGKIRHVATSDFLLSGIAGGLYEVSPLVGIPYYRYEDDGSRNSINPNLLRMEEMVTVVGSPSASTKKLKAKKVIAKPLYTSFVALVKEVGDSITLQPKTAWGTAIKLVPLKNFSVQKYDPVNGVFSPATQNEVMNGDKVLVDGLEEELKTDIFYVRNLVILPK